MKYRVIYWSQTGNTEEMANAVAEGINEAGGEAEVLEVTDISPEDLSDDKAFALGCPAMGDEVLEEGDMEPFVEELEASVKDKKIALFGSYGWGDGEWMRSWVERMQNAGAEIVTGEGLIVQESPEDEDLEKCKNLGKALTE